MNDRDQMNAFTNYITARLNLEAAAEQQAIAAAGAFEADATEWPWVQRDRIRREATKALVAVLNKRVGVVEGRAALMWVAAQWGEHPPLADRTGRPYTSNGGGLTYLSSCCQATVTYSGATLCCRNCYEEADPTLVCDPKPSATDALWDHT